jgi:hypothetical protein
VDKLQVMVSASKAELWDSITYFATTTGLLSHSGDENMKRGQDSYSFDCLSPLFEQSPKA